MRKRCVTLLVGVRDLRALTPALPLTIQGGGGTVRSRLLAVAEVAENEKAEFAANVRAVTDGVRSMLERANGVLSTLLALQEKDAGKEDVTRDAGTGALVTEADAALEGLKGELSSANDWRILGREGSELPEGSRLPLSLLAAVYVDSFIDGFLLGISCQVNKHAGLVLAAANVLEMGFVGASFANTVSRCTAESAFTRRLAIYSAPAVLLGSSVVGTILGNFAISIPALFVGFVAFGCVGLIFLVTHELLIEASATAQNERVWCVGCGGGSVRNNVERHVLSLTRKTGCR